MPVARRADRPAVTDEGEQYGVVRLGDVGEPVQGLQNVLPGRALGAVRRVAQEEPNVLGRDAEVFLISEQPVEGLRVVLGVSPRLDLVVLVLSDADNDRVRVRRVLFLRPGRPPSDERDERGE